MKYCRIRRRKLSALPKSRLVWQQKTILSPMGDCTYYLCPKCGIPLDREFVRFCDQCGQKLNWRAV